MDDGTLDRHPDLAGHVPPPALGTRLFPPERRPTVLVRHRDGRWYPGRLHAWLRPRDRSGWHAVVTYQVGPGLQHYLWVPATSLRPAEDDEQ